MAYFVGPLVAVALLLAAVMPVVRELLAQVQGVL